MLIHIQVTEEDLRQLAMNREERVKDYLLDARSNRTGCLLIIPHSSTLNGVVMRAGERRFPQRTKTLGPQVEWPA
jgi:hypothetical protein